MFEHRLAMVSKPFPWLRAAVGLVVLAGMVVAGRHWLQTKAEPLPQTKLAERGAPTALATPASNPTTQRNAPITQLALLVFKSEKRMEVWGQRVGKWEMLRDYPILAASGVAGPKLREGDRQVPEGVYAISAMNPQSRFHRSIKLDYPNAFDKKMALSDGRTRLGGDICIHGKNCSVGCVAIGDAAIEDLYALVESVKPGNVKTIIAPNDIRARIPVRNPNLRLPWINELYANLARELKPFTRN